MKRTVQEMRMLHKESKTTILTLGQIPQLKGKTISTIYFGYKGQDGVDTFVVGDLISDWDKASQEIMGDGRTRQEMWLGFMSEDRIEEHKQQINLITADGRDTYIRCHKDWNKDIFTCSDVDRYVYFILEENE